MFYIDKKLLNLLNLAHIRKASKAKLVCGILLKMNTEELKRNREIGEAGNCRFNG